MPSQTSDSWCGPTGPLWDQFRDSIADYARWIDANEAAITASVVDYINWVEAAMANVEATAASLSAAVLADIEQRYEVIRGAYPREKWLEAEHRVYASMERYPALMRLMPLARRWGWQRRFGAGVDGALVAMAGQGCGFPEWQPPRIELLARPWRGAGLDLPTTELRPMI